MKFLAVILSVIVLALAVMPCCTFDNCDDDSQTEHANTKKTNDCETPCSPFVSCTCCPGICVTPTIEFVTASSIVVEKSYTIYNQSFVSLYCPNIWQPPKIAC